MSAPEATPREMLARLEATAHREDEVMQRAIEALRETIEDREIIESLTQRAIQANMARTGFIVELAMALTEQEQGCKIISLPQFRRPKPRLVS